MGLESRKIAKKGDRAGRAAEGLSNSRATTKEDNAPTKAEALPEEGPCPYWTNDLALSWRAQCSQNSDARQCYGLGNALIPPSRVRKRCIGVFFYLQVLTYFCLESGLAVFFLLLT